MRKVLSLLLAIVMVIGMVPMTAFASTVDSGAENLALAEGAYAYGINNDGSVIEPIAGRDDTMLAGCAIDGNLDNEAIPGAGHNGGWDLVVVLPEAVDNVNTIHYHGSKIVAQNAPNYSVWTSADGQNWELVKYGQEAPGTNNPNTYVNNSEYKEITFSNRTVKAVMFKDDTNCNFMRVAELEIYADPDVDVLPNLAYGKPVSGYRVDDMEPIPEAAQTGFVSWLTDGIKENYVYGGLGRYSAHAYDVDLGADYENVSKVITSFVKDGNHGVPKSYGVAVKSSTDADWTVVANYNPAANDEPISTIEHTFNPRTVRYVRVQGFTEESQPGQERAMFISEIEAYQDPSVLVNEALGKPVKLLRGSDLIELEAPAGIEMVTNGWYDNFYYGSNSLYSWHAYEVDLGAEVEGIDTIVTGYIALGDGHGIPRDYEISVAGEDKVWYNVTTVYGAENPTGIHKLKYEFPDKAVRYILVRSLSEVGGRAMYIAEIEAYANPDLNLEEKESLVNYAQTEGIKVWATNTVTGELIDETAYQGYETATITNINDGDYTNEAIPGVGHHFWDVYFELPEAVEGINNIKIYGSQVLHQVPPSCSISVSPDGIIWDTVYQRVADDNSANAYTKTPSVIDAQFNAPFPIKFITFQDASNANFMRIAEFEIYADPDVTVEATSNLAYFKPVRLLAPDGETELPFVGNEAHNINHPRHITDGNPGTVSIAAGSYQWQAEIDLGEVKSGVNTAKVIFGADVDNSTPLQFSVWTSEDGAEWEKMATNNFGTVDKRTGEVTLTFPNRNAQYIRVSDDLATEYNSQGAQIQMVLADVEIYADPDVNIIETTNAAYGKPVTLLNGALEPMETAPDGIESITNGSINDTYYGGSTYSWHAYVVDLEEEQVLNKVVTSFATTADGHGVPRDYVVEVAGEDGVYTIVDSCCNNPANVANGVITIEHTFAATAVRYVRVRSLSEIGGRGMFVAEIEAYADANITVLPSDNLALNKETKLLEPFGKVELGYVGNEGSHVNHNHHMVDGNIETLTIAAGSYQWLGQIDLGAVVEGINTVKVVFGENVENTAPLCFYVMTSADGVTWEKAATKRFKSPAEKEREVTLTFPNTNAQYIRVMDGLQEEYNTAGERIQMALAEVEVYANPNVNIEQTAVNYARVEGVKVFATDSVSGELIDETIYEGYEVNQLANINDGNYENEAIPGLGNNRWDVYFELPEAVKGINTVLVYGSKIANQTPPSYSVSVSEDGVTWEPAFVKVAESNETGDYLLTPYILRIEFETLKPVKFIAFQDGSDTNFMRIAEIEIYADAEVEKAVTSNLAFEKSVKLLDPSGTRELMYVGHESHNNFHPSHITDGNPDTISVAAGSYQWQAEIDLGAVETGINTAEITFGADVDNAVPLKFSVWTSETGETWDLAAEKDFGTVDARERTVTLTFDAVDAQYIRVSDDLAAEFNSAGAQIQMALAEVKIYANPDDEEPDEPEPTPDATAPVVTLAGTATVEGWTVTEWSDDANTVKVNVVDAEGFTSTITVNGEAYVSGSDITLTAEGTIEVVVTTSAEGYNTVTNTYTITVPAKTEPEVPQVIGSEVYTIADGFIRKIEVGTTVNELLGNVTPAGGDIKVYKSETAATAMRGTVAVGTGNVVKLFDANGDVVDSLTVVILGDVSGDGKINATDLISLVAYIGGSREYTEAQTIAANLMQPARPTINAQDLGYLKDAINGTKTITQK